ncbi:MAG: hypothetical protein AB1384_08320 [Actinomycetota bacterium]
MNMIALFVGIAALLTGIPIILSHRKIGNYYYLLGRNREQQVPLSGLSDQWKFVSEDDAAKWFLVGGIGDMIFGIAMILIAVIFS